ncbi:MAG TPA: methionine--tRNA ligase subunit beta, partial [Bacillota bacterium]|nr:methionine--tRNA ligase subunit beta [Bacillota bacterium]
RTPERIWAQLGLQGQPDLQSWASLQSWGLIQPGTKVCRKEDLFPRLNLQEELNRDDPAKAAPKVRPEEEKPGLITLDMFQQVEVRVGRIVEAAPVPGADKLLQLKVDLGEGEPRQVVAGIALYYRPEELLDRLVLFAANLKPVKLRGILSQGMLLAAEDEQGRLALTTVDKEIAVGSRVR